MKIAHLADVHIRGLTRHEEMRVVFEALAADVKERKVDHLFVAGDIFHTKTQNITPEYIKFMTWWLKHLSAAAPLHMMLGNHDFNVRNSSRVDAISPIVEAVNDPRVFLYKKSGVYQFHPGFNWCVFSLVDEDNWDSVRPVQGDFNIACYHGPVNGAKTEVGWELEGGVELDMFEEFDACMLGDIHAQQFLDTREYEIEIDESDLVNYPGAEIVEE